MKKVKPGTYIGSLAIRLEDIIKKNEEEQDKKTETNDDDPSLWGIVDLDEFNYDEFLREN